MFSEPWITHYLFIEEKNIHKSDQQKAKKKNIAFKGFYD